MKKEITGYITGIINSYSRTIERLKANGAPIAATNPFTAFKEELTDLLEFVIDIPDSKETSILSFNVAIENVTLKKRIAELEESCECMCDVERNLHKKIEELETAEIANREQLLDDKQKIEESEKEKNEFWECNKQLNELYKEKRNKSESLQAENKNLKYANKRMRKQVKILRNNLDGMKRKNV